MNRIDLTLMYSVIVLAVLVMYPFWFMAHPRSEKRATAEAYEWARRSAPP